MTEKKYILCVAHDCRGTFEATAEQCALGFLEHYWDDWASHDAECATLDRDHHPGECPHCTPDGQEFEVLECASINRHMATQWRARDAEWLLDRLTEDSLIHEDYEYSLIDREGFTNAIRTLIEKHIDPDYWVPSGKVIKYRWTNDGPKKCE
jgi:hypothetical protein